MPVTEVSVITAANNSAGLIERNIRSVGAQSLRPKEHIIVDDGSYDDTAAIVQGLTGEFPHLRLLRQVHAGAAMARNAGILAASGRYVAFLDSDDLWSEGKLEAQIGFMTANDVAFSYGDYDAMDAGTGILLGRYEGPDHVTYADLLRGCSIGCLTAAFDQSLLGKRYMPNVRRGQDWGFWLALTRTGTVARRYPGCHAVYCQSSTSLSSAKLAKVADIYSIYRVQEKLGRLRSLRFLIPHILGALRKRPVLDHGARNAQ